MAYADFQDYKHIYFGNVIPEDAFGRVAERASEYIDFITFNRLREDIASREIDEVIKCNCAMAELIYNYEQSSQDGDMQKISEKVGEYSVQYAAATDKSGHVLNINEKKHTLAKQYLGHTGLMYRGW